MTETPGLRHGCLPETRHGQVRSFLPRTSEDGGREATKTVCGWGVVLVEARPINLSGLVGTKQQGVQHSHCRLGRNGEGTEEGPSSVSLPMCAAHVFVLCVRGDSGPAW